ncbi:MAG TPA: LacI family DNA-binding transcriptional regulator [Candidatus Atribacteria bacterium]|jgi:DNA-binding LacI/PurR family transcriptional regulator|nr:LacI family DNA-binding transcriptional regulator [Atribacterota bacterium]NLY05305.1 LacI family transcriptional regulator [Candidatus Atribacteria bacterium]MDI9608115.1 LacI family DNA-binding transcriptional regulator [Atribacterota bacterium]HOA99053.1 LacI family DNA-binding transcriptional regulator [Candidatus Atribacteria bacterium]HOQ50867.1 LacI family DNA-binding transcriptional regulator [Candidatus Atribacteria bacterium]
MKITTDELCRRSGVSPSTVLRTLNGSSAISEETKRGVSPPGKRVES